MHQSWSLFFLSCFIVALTMPSPSIQDAKPFCPVGGTWHVCTTGSLFLGCCTSDPCQDGCPSGDLRAASYNTTYLGKFADQQCHHPAKFYTCAKTIPSFLGCCKSDPCQLGSCPKSDLDSTYLSNNSVNAADFTASLSVTSASATLSIASASATASAFPTTSSTEPTLALGQPRLSIGAIVGIVAGSLVVLLALAGLLAAFSQRRSKTYERRNPESQGYTSPMNTAPVFNDPLNNDDTRYLTPGTCIFPTFHAAPNNTSIQDQHSVHQHSIRTDRRTHLRLRFQPAREALTFSLVRVIVSTHAKWQTFPRGCRN
jgi:hypothetical protein